MAGQSVNVVICELAGGPLDGTLIRRHLPAWCWIEPVGQGEVRCWRQKKRGAFLYRASGRKRQEADLQVRVFEHADNTHAVCVNCAVLHERQVKACSMCGSPLPR